MAPLRWGVRGSDGAVSGDDGRGQVRDAERIRHRKEELILTAQKRPGPPEGYISLFPDSHLAFAAAVGRFCRARPNRRSIR